MRFARANGVVVEQWLRHLADKLHELIPGQPALALVLFHNERKTVMASVTVPDTATDLTASVAFLDAEGSPTTADDVPVWSSSDESVAKATASEDGLSATFEVGAPGAAVISVSSTNTDGSTASAEGTITVQPGDAVIGEVTFNQ